MNPSPDIGDFVEVRGRPWLVEGIDDKGGGLSALQLSCISDDAQGETLEVAWDAEIGARRLEDDFWSRLGRDGTDDPADWPQWVRLVPHLLTVPVASGWMRMTGATLHACAARRR